MAIAFDLDGTLVDSTPDLLAAINGVLIQYNLPQTDRQENLSVAGGGLESMFALTIEKKAPTWTSDKKKQLKNEMLELYQLDPSTRTTPFPGMVSLLEALQAQGIPICVISNKLLALTQKILHLKFPSIQFTKIYGIDSGFPPKPDSSSLLDFKSSLKKGEALIYLGDTEIDYKTAHGVADRVFLATWGYRGHDALLAQGFDPHIMVRDASQLADALDSMLS